LGLEEALKKLRYVPRYPLPGSEVRSEDHNYIVDALKALSAECRAVMPGDPLVDELDAAIAKIRYLRTGDIYEPEDHNYIVDALKKSRDVLSNIESFYTGLKDQLEECQTALTECRSRLEECLARPPFKACKVSTVDVSITKPAKAYKVSTVDVTISKFAKSISIGRA